MRDAGKITGGLFDGRAGRGKALVVSGPDESFIQSDITKYLDGRAVVYAVTNAKTVQTVNGPRQLVYPQGWADITAILPITGQIWAIEVKTDDGDQREAQKDVQALIEASGGKYTVARDRLIIRQILNDHLAKYGAVELREYFHVIESLKRIYRQHLDARKIAAKIRRFTGGQRRGRRAAQAASSG